MAGTPIVGEKQTYFQEDVDVNSINSESIMTKIVKGIAFTQENSEFPYIINYEGYFRPTQITNGCMSFVCVRRFEISKYVLAIANLGTQNTGYSVINANIYDSDGSFVGQLFDTNQEPAIEPTSNGLSNRYVGRDVIGASDILSTTANMNYRVGTLNFTTLEEGYVIRPFLTGNTSNAIHASLAIYLQGLE